MKLKRILLPALAIAAAITLSGQAQATGFHSCEATDSADWASVEALKEKVAADGFEYRRHKPDGGCYEVYIRYTDDRIAEAYYHPVTLELEIIQRRGNILYEKPEAAADEKAAAGEESVSE